MTPDPSQSASTSESTEARLREALQAITRVYTNPNADARQAADRMCQIADAALASPPPAPEPAEARTASPSPAVAPLDLPGHKCRKIAEANPCGTGRELWLGELLEPIPGYEHETHCLHVTTPMKSVVFGVYRGDFDLLSVFGYLVADRKPLTERWLGRMSDAFVKRAAYAEASEQEGEDA